MISYLIADQQNVSAMKCDVILEIKTIKFSYLIIIIKMNLKSELFIGYTMFLFSH